MKFQFAPIAEPTLFENFCRDFFEVHKKTTHSQLVGRQGQQQYGVDVLLTFPNFHEGVQCKKFSFYTGELSTNAIDEIVEKATHFKPAISHLYIATTAPRDQKTQRHAAGLIKQFSTSIFAWEDFNETIPQYPSLIKKYFSEFIISPNSFDSYDFTNEGITKIVHSSDAINREITDLIAKSSMSQNFGAEDSALIRSLLIEIAKNAFKHSKATKLEIAIHQNEIAMVYDGSQYDPYSLLNETHGRGGRWQIEEFLTLCLDKFHLAYEFNDLNQIIITFPGKIDKVGTTLPMSLKIDAYGNSVSGPDVIQFILSHPNNLVFFIYLDDTVLNPSNIWPLFHQIGNAISNKQQSIHFFINEGNRRFLERSKSFINFKWGYSVIKQFTL